MASSGHCCLLGVVGRFPCCCGWDTVSSGLRCSAWAELVVMGSLLLIQTTLCNTSLDNPTQRNKDQLIRAAVKFLDTDTIW